MKIRYLTNPFSRAHTFLSRLWGYYNVSDVIFEYLESTDGNGVVDADDLSNWQMYNSSNGLTNDSGL